VDRLQDLKKINYAKWNGKCGRLEMILLINLRLLITKIIYGEKKQSVLSNKNTNLQYLMFLFRKLCLSYCRGGYRYEVNSLRSAKPPPPPSSWCNDFDYKGHWDGSWISRLFWALNWQLIYAHKVTNVPVFYMVLRLNDFDGVESITRAIGKGVPWKSRFF
jgi:hypothetical protein